MTVTRSVPDREPTSREINEAIELLKRAGADAQGLRLLNIWNANRLVEASLRVETHEELRNLYAGLKPILPGVKYPAADQIDEGAWS